MVDFHGLRAPPPAPDRYPGGIHSPLADAIKPMAFLYFAAKGWEMLNPPGGEQQQFTLTSIEG